MAGAAITEPALVKPILVHLGLPPDPPTVAPARRPPLLDINQTLVFDPTDPEPVPGESRDGRGRAKQAGIVPDDPLHSGHCTWMCRCREAQDVRERPSMAVRCPNRVRVRPDRVLVGLATPLVRLKALARRYRLCAAQLDQNRAPVPRLRRVSPRVKYVRAPPAAARRPRRSLEFLSVSRRAIL